MGTSSNHPSPKTPNWNLAKASIGALSVSPERQSKELWAAAAADRKEALVEALSSPLLANACVLADTYPLPVQAVRELERTILKAHSSNLFLDLGKRALARSVASKSGKVGFASELFAETAGYYVSRDLSSFVGKKGRIGNVSQAIKLKEQISNYARDIAKTHSVKSDPKGWRAYILKVLQSLQVRGKE